MPRYSEPAQMTPFAQVLVNYMWNRRSPFRPPMGVAQLAHALGMPRQNVNNWVIRGTVPTFDIILAVLARLDIPLRDLYDAYQRAGMAVPRWDENDRLASIADTPTQVNLPVISRSRKPTAVQITHEDDNASNYVPATSRITAPAPRPYIPPPPFNEAEAFQHFVDSSAATLRDAGLPEREVEAMVAYLHARRQGIDPIQRHILAEHSEPAPESANEQPEQQPARTGKRKSAERAGK